MATKKKDEVVSVSFHYLTRRVKNAAGARVDAPFSRDEFDALCAKLLVKPEINLNDDQVANRVRFRFEVPLLNPERVNNQTFFGTFRGSYWGHSYENTVKGLIPSDSISLRPFFYLLYFGKSGRIYVGAQYLGTFGGYHGLLRTLTSLMADPESITSHSYRLGAGAYKNAEAKEVRVTFSDKSKALAGNNLFGARGTIAFKKAAKDDGFEATVKERLLPHVGASSSQVRHALKALMNESALLEVDDSDILDCVVIADINGKRKTIHMIEDGNFATRFPLDIETDENGHPPAGPAKAEMLRVLAEQIISRAENV